MKETPTFERAPPFDNEAEKGVLGSILLMPEACDQVAHIIEPSDFLDDVHGKIYRHLLAMREAKRGIDSVTLVDCLKRANEYETVGGAAYIGKIMNSVATAAHAVYYADIVRDKSILRGLISAATNIIRGAYEHSADVSSLISEAESSIAAVGANSGSHEARLISAVSSDTLKELKQRLASSHRPGVLSGIAPLDNGMGPIMPGELAIIAARPGCGKTALAMQYAERVSERSGGSVLFVSLEMKDRELVRRELSRLAGLDSRDVRSLHVSESDLQLLEQAGELFDGRRLWLWDKSNSTMSEIRNAAKQINARERLDLVVVDYIGLIESAKHEQQLKRYELIGKFTRGLKNLAKDIDAPVIALCQLNREADGQRPRLSMLRESGNIEQDADTVLFVHHDEGASRNKTSQEPRSAELIVAKHRHSEVGIINVFWTPAQTRFSGEIEWTG